MPDVVVIGAGMVGSACAYYAAQAGLSVTLVDRGTVACGTTGSGEGNVLVSDKEPGPELDLAMLSRRLWSELACDTGEIGDFEYEPKGGLVVAGDDEALRALTELAARQRESGVVTRLAAGGELAEYEPHLAPGFAGGVFYPQDAQVQPMLAAARLIRRWPRVTLRAGVEVSGILHKRGRVTGVRTATGDIPAGAVVNAAGPWAGKVAALAGTELPILPRRGFVVVTEPLASSPERSRAGGSPLIRHKVYTAAYVTDVASDSAGLEASAVVEATRAGTVLIGASRERVGFDRTVSLPVLARLARQAIALFPALADVRAIRAYCGFRPYCPDHLPVIGPDPRVRGLFHACGHEGAGIGLAPATGLLIAQLITGTAPELDPAPFRPDRFAEAAA